MEADPANSRLVRIIYLWTCFGFAGALLAAKTNLAWHGLRRGPDFLLFERVCEITVGPLFWLGAAGVVALLSSINARRRWDIWLAVSLVILALYNILPLFPF